MLILADARHIPLRDACVDCVVTSPPYFGLRDYSSCTQIGLESTVTGYLDSIRSVFCEIRRVLKPTGTVWLNLGDSYNNADKWGGGGANTGKHTRAVDGEVPSWSGVRRRWRGMDGTKPKDLLGVPWRVAFALQADGWYLRSDIIWSKPNPMPESVQDRPTKAHEYLFLLTKSERYHYDARAIAEPVSDAMLMQIEQGYDGLGLKDYEAAGVQNPSSVKARIIAKARHKAANIPGQSAHGYTKQEDGTNCGGNGLTRNRRSVWAISTQSYIGAHFATMPEKLVEPCILAGCPMGGLVFDPFLGSGTVGAVAERLGRRWVGTDSNPAYHALAKQRTAQRGLMFGEATA